MGNPLTGSTRDAPFPARGVGDLDQAVSSGMDVLQQAYPPRPIDGEDVDELHRAMVRALGAGRAGTARDAAHASSGLDGLSGALKVGPDRGSFASTSAPSSAQ